MPDFSELTLSEEYLQPYCLMCERSGMVFVESMRDISFWDGILNNNPNVMPYSISNISDNGARGKTVLKKYMHLTNRFAIFAMDSDFDYICPSNSEDSIAINQNKFILQTIVHSKESINYHHSVIDECISKIQVTTKINFSIRDFLESYSKKIYCALLAFLFLKEKRVNLNDNDFHKSISLSSVLIDSNYCFIGDPLSSINNSLQEKKNELESFIENTEEFENFIEETKSKGLTEKNAYQYVNGHHLEDNVVLPVINELIKILKEKEFSIIKEECKETPKQIEERKRELFNFIKEELNFKSLIHNCALKFSTSCSEKIKNSIPIEV